MLLHNMSVRFKMLSLIGVFVFGFIGFTAFVFVSMKPKLEDSEYREVVVMKDVVADVLPPPKYIIESYLVLLEMTHESDARRRAELEGKWTALKQTFEERQMFWDQTLSDGRLKQALNGESASAAREFFTLAEEQFLPAAHAGDAVKMHELLVGTLQDAYARHRRHIDDVVAVANQQSEAYVAQAAATIIGRKWKLLALSFLILGAGIAFGIMVARSLTTRVERTAAVLEAVAQGDFTVQLDDRSSDELGQLATALNTAVASMRSALSEVMEHAESVTGSARELSASAELIASGAHEQAASLEESAASLEQITATVQQSSDNAQMASQLASGSRETAERGGSVVTQAIAAMHQIDEASSKIADIIGTIDEIAFQTNILALNAAVEAARAGDQGASFAIVAERVGLLSQRSASAAKEIKGLIQDATRKVASGAELVNRSGNSLHEIVSSVKRVTDIVQDMASATREQATGLGQVNLAVSQMDAVVHSNSAQTRQLSETASALAGHAEQLRRLVNRFQVGKSDTYGRENARDDREDNVVASRSMVNRLSRSNGSAEQLRRREPSRQGRVQAAKTSVDAFVPSPRRNGAPSEASDERDSTSNEGHIVVPSVSAMDAAMAAELAGNGRPSPVAGFDEV